MHSRLLPQTFRLVAATSLLTASCGPAKPKEPDLPQQEDRWVESVVLDEDSKAKYVGRTRDLLVTSISRVGDVQDVQRISVGDEIEGLRVGAIRCSFNTKEASYAGEQFMWRGRWSCQAGRDRQEIENAVGPEGEKRHDYIHVRPVRLPE